MDQNETLVDNETSNIGPWSEWARMVVSKIESTSVQLCRMEDKMDSMIRNTEDKVDKACERLNSLEISHSKLETEFKVKVGRWGAIMTAAVITVLTLIEIIKGKFWG